MGRTPQKVSKSFSERLRERLSSVSRSSPASDEERAKIRALGEQLEQSQFSTIARAMSEGNATSASQRRPTALIHRIIEWVEEHPGQDVHELSRQLGEKSIVVLSSVDELLKEGLLVRLEDGRLYRSRDFLPASIEEQSPVAASGDEVQTASARLQLVRIYLRVFRFLTSELGLEPHCSKKLTVRISGGKFFEMKEGKGCFNISLYGMFPRELVERFKRDSGLDRRRINYSHLTGIVDFRGCRFEDLDAFLPWVGEFFVVYRQGNH